MSHRYPPDGRAGVELYTQSLAETLSRWGDSVHVVTRRVSPTAAKFHTSTEETSEGMTVHRIVGRQVGLDRFFTFHDHIEREFENVLKLVRPDTVHFNHLLELSPRVVEIVQRAGIPFVISLHDFYFSCPLAHLQKQDGRICDGPRGGRECAETCFSYDDDQRALRWALRAMYYRRILHSATRVIAYSRYLAEYFVDSALEITVVPHGVAPELHARADEPDSALELLRKNEQSPGGPQKLLRLAYLGAVTPHKGIHALLQALELAKLEHVELVAFGTITNATYAYGLRETAQHIPGLRFWMYGGYTPRELPVLLADVDFVVVPSQVPEAAGIAPREALALGIPVLCSRIGALPELVDEGVNGFTFDAGDPDELAALLSRIVTDKERESLRAGASGTKIPSFPEHARAIREVYEQAVIDCETKKPRPAELDETNFLGAKLSELAALPEL